MNSTPFPYEPMDTLTYGGHSPVEFAGIEFSQSGFLLAITIKANAIILIFISLLSTSTVAGLGHGLQELHLSPKLCMLLLLSYRYLAVINQEYMRLQRAAKLRCFSPGSNLHTYTTYGHLMGMLFKGEQLQQEKEFKKLRRSVGMVFQDADDQLFSPTVIEDVAFGPLNLGASPEEAGEISQKTLAELGLAGLADRVTHQLSGGEKKLVSLATILSMQPEAMLLDEPTNNLDPETRARLIEIINGLDIGCMIISHDWDFLSETCNDLYALNNGRALHSDTSCLHIHRHAHSYGEHPHEHDHVHEQEDKS